MTGLTRVDESDENPRDLRLAVSQNLRQLIDQLPGVTVAAGVSDVAGAVAALESDAPDALLLDIQMPGESGLDLAKHPLLPPVIFVTAHEQHAVPAFDQHAVDYLLLKPVTRERLQKALTRIAAREPTAAGGAAAPRLAVRDGDTIELVDIRRLTRLTASEKYVVCVLDGTERLLDESLNGLEERLTPHGFLRTHRAELVNVQAV